jgi:hypothetical protein
MNTPVADQVASLIAGIEPAGLAALRVGFTFAVIVFLLAGVFIFRRRHQLFDGDPNVENDVPVVLHNRVEEVIFYLERPNAGFTQHSFPSLERVT